MKQDNWTMFSVYHWVKSGVFKKQIIHTSSHFLTRDTGAEAQNGHAIYFYSTGISNNI